MNRGLTVVDYGNWQYTTLLKAVQMLSTDISAAVLSISSHSGATTLRNFHDDTEASIVNQGNLVETCIGTHFPEPHDPLYNAQRARAMRDCIERVAHAIDVIYKVCRRAHMDKRGDLIEPHTINLRNVAICTESTLGFACVLVALARIGQRIVAQGVHRGVLKASAKSLEAKGYPATMGDFFMGKIEAIEEQKESLHKAFIDEFSKQGVQDLKATKETTLKIEGMISVLESKVQEYKKGPQIDIKRMAA